MQDRQVKNILVVDDLESTRNLLHRFLTLSDYMCETAADSQEALGLLAEKHFDMVLSDIKMQGMDGLELMVRAKELYPHLDFIIVTGHADEYSYSSIIKAGATDFATKPLELGELRAKLERIEREKQTLHQLQKANQALAWESEIKASIAELSEALISSTALEDISLLVLKHAKTLTESPWGMIGYIDHTRGSLMQVAVSGDLGEIIWIPDSDLATRRTTGLWEWVLDNRKTSFDHHHTGGSLSQEAPPVIRHFLSVPALADETLVGIVSVANSPRSYSEQDLLLIKRLAVIYALALQRKQKEDEVGQARDYLDSVLDNSPTGISIVDSHGRFVKCNKMAAELYGNTAEELKGMSCFDVYPHKEELDQMLAQLRSRGFVRGYRIKIKTGDGSVVPFIISISLLKDTHGRNMGSVCVVEDVGR